MVGGRGLWIPDVAGVSGQVALLHHLDQRVGFDYCAAGGVDEVGALLHAEQQVLVEQASRLGRERYVDSDHVAGLGERVEPHVARAQGGLVHGAQVHEVVVVHGDVERLQPRGHALADAAHAHDADGLVLEVVRASGDLAYVPAAGHHLVVGREVVAHEGEYLHDGVLGDAHDVTAGNLGDGDVALGGRGEVHVVGAYAGGENGLQTGGLLHLLLGDVGGPERRGDDDVGGGQMAVQLLARVGDSHQLVAGALHHLAQAQCVLGTAQQLGSVLCLGATGVQYCDDFHDSPLCVNLCAIRCVRAPQSVSETR